MKGSGGEMGSILHGEVADLGDGKVGHLVNLGMQMTQHTPEIWTIEDFLTAKACEDLILLAELRGFEEAAVNLPGGAQMMKGLRNNDRLLYEDKDLAERYWEVLKGYCPGEMNGWKAVGLNEQFRFYRYASAQRFKRHIDGRFRRSVDEESRITFMVYLNADYVGGETAFDGVVIKPKTGTALCFVHELKHEGMPVLEGVKYALRSDVMYRSQW